MGNAVLQELFGPLSNDLNALADLATAVALFAGAVGACRLRRSSGGGIRRGTPGRGRLLSRYSSLRAGGYAADGYPRRR